MVWWGGTATARAFERLHPSSSGVLAMAELRDKQEVLAVMRRLRLADMTERASAVLPDVVDLHRDRDVLFALGLPKDLDAAIDRLGGSP